MLRILHAADLHLDAPFAALTAEQARQRRGEQRQLLDRLADVAIEGKADLVLLAGDLLDSSQTHWETVQALAAALGRIPAPVIIAPGNHDPYTDHSLYAGAVWPKNTIIFPDDRIRRLELPFCDIYGAAFTSAYQDRSPLAGFRAVETGKPAIMVLHADVDGTGRYGPITRQEIADSGLTYLALGHVHSCSGLQWAGNTAWAYPGCTEGRGFDETGTKGALWVTIGDSGVVRADLLPLALRRYEDLECDVTDRDPAQALAEVLCEGSSRDILRLTLTGEAEGLDLAALEGQLRQSRWCAQLRDHTRLPRGLWERAGEKTLTGIFLRNLREKLSRAGSEEERLRLEQAARFGLAALENGEDLP